MAVVTNGLLPPIIPGAQPALNCYEKEKPVFHYGQCGLLKTKHGRLLFIVILELETRSNRGKMDNEKLSKANLLTDKIKDLKKSLDFLDAAREEGNQHKDYCHINGNGKSKNIDHDIFEIALTLQEKRIHIELSDLERKFKEL